MLCILLLATLACSCYTDVEGCIDPESTNYAISADNPCDGCCIYPVVKLSIFHQNGDTTFFLGEDTLVNNQGQAYSIIKYAYLLSDFRMTLSDGQVVEVEDSIRLNTEDGTLYTKDDVIRVRRDGFTYTLGTAVFDEAGSSIAFKVGLSPLLNENRFTSAVTDHPLTTDPDSLYRSIEDDYVFVRVQVAQGVDLRDTVVYDVVGPSGGREVSVPVGYTSVRGTDKTIIIEARYDEWLADVDFETMDKATIESIISERSASMFRARE